MKTKIALISFVFVLWNLPKTVAQNIYYFDFEDSSSASGWVLTNGTQSSQWCIGTAVNNTPGGSRCLYISADSGATHSYGSTESHVFASRMLYMDSGDYLVNYDWRCKMPTVSYNRLRVAFVPGVATFTPGDNTWWTYSVPSEYICIDSANGFNGNKDWTSYRQRVHIDSSGTYTLAFVFNCSGYYLSSMWTAPAIDNISVEPITCPMADSLTAVASADSVWLNWKEADTMMRWLVSWNGHTVAEDTSFAAIGGLEMGKKYDFYVSPICSSDTGFYELLSMVMPCDSLRRLPYFLHFDDIYVDPYTEYNRMPDCWTRLCTNTAPNNLGLSPALNSYPTYGVGGTTGLYWILASYLPSQYAVLPPVAESLGPMDSLVVTFEAKRVSAHWTKLIVGVMTDPNDSTTFVAVDSVNIQGSSFTEYSVPLTGYTDTGRCVALHIKGGSTIGANMAYQMAMDNIGLSKISDCTPPVSVVKHPYPDHIDLSWTPGNGENLWEIFCNGVSIDYVLNNQYTFSNLQPSTEYMIDLYSVCSNGDISLPRHFIVTTKCQPAELPYSYDFSGDEFDKCWYKSSNYPELSNGTLRFEPLWSRYSYAVLPIYPASVTPLEFSFSLKQDTIQVGVVDDPYDISSFVPIRTILKSRNGIWERYYCYFNGYTGTGRYLAFRSPSTGYTGYINDAFVDSVEVKVAPSCPTPDTYRLLSRGHNSATFSWYGQGQSLFRIDYAPEGGTTTTLYSQNDTLTLTGLQPSTDYTVSIRIVCGDGDTSIALTGAFHTFAPPATVPYSCGFDSSCSDGWTLFNGNNINRWCVGQAAYNDTSDHHGLYISDDSGATSQCTFTSTSLVMAVRNFSLQAGNYNYSYDYRRTGSAGDNEYFGAALLPDSILLKDGTDFARTWYGSHIPAGGIQLQDYVQYILTPDGSWNTCSGQIVVPSSGNWNLVFFWRNSNNSGMNPPAAVDNVFLDINSCPSVSGLTVENMTNTTADVDWTENGDATSWRVEYGPHGFTPGNGNFHTFYTHPCTLPYLSPSTTYDIYVQPVCADSQFVFPTGPVTITTEVCEHPDISLWGDSNYSDDLKIAPVFVFSPYSATVTLLDSSTLNGPHNFEGVRFFYTGNTPLTAKEDINIYLQSTHLNNFSYNNNALYDSITSRLVFSGPFDFNYGWNTVAFDSIYPYSGDGNILMIIIDNSGGSQNDASFRGYTAYNANCIYFYDNIQAPPLSALTTATGVWNYTMPFMQLYSCTPYCAAPSELTVDTVGYNFVVLSWNGEANAYEVTLHSLSDTTMTNVVSTTTANSITLNGITHTSHYLCTIRSICDSSISQSATIDFFTDTLLCGIPENFEISDIDYTSTTFGWQPGENESEWLLHIWNTAVDTVTVVSDNHYVFRGLAQGVGYYAAVCAFCGGGVIQSDYSDTLHFTMPICPPAENLQTLNITPTSAEIIWESQTASCDVEYGFHNFSVGTGTLVGGVTNNRLNLYNLTPGEYYDVAVKAQCGDGIFSQWSVVTFKTQAIGFDVCSDNADAIIFPNPTSHYATITLTEIHGPVDIEVCDLCGRIVKSQTFNCNGSCNTRLDVTELHHGSYFIKIIGDRINIVKKMVIK